MRRRSTRALLNCPRFARTERKSPRRPTNRCASRLESSTKELGTPVLISEDTYALVKDHIDARAVKEITVKGREKPVMTYEVLGLKGETASPKSDPVPLPIDA